MRHLFLTSGPKAVDVGRTIGVRVQKHLLTAPTYVLFFWKHIFFSDHLNHVFFFKDKRLQFPRPPKPPTQTSTSVPHKHMLTIQNCQ